MQPVSGSVHAQEVSPSAAPQVTPTVKPSPTPAPSSTPLPTATIPTTYLKSTVWSKDPLVPALLYHRFMADSFSHSTRTKTRLADFKNDLQRLYDAGYSLISTEDWLAGIINVPVGRRPLIITLDDLFFADQVFINPDNQPSTSSGIGVLWEFSQNHPDFGFAADIFFNLGDKHYGNVPSGPYFLEGEGWEDQLGRVIAWCIEHNVRPYNHFYTHPRLDWTKDDGVQPELAQNDKALRKYLKRIKREDLIDKIGNLPALPYSLWPESPNGKNIIKKYINPEGKPVAGIYEAGYHYDPHFIQASYSPELDIYHLPRMAALPAAIDFLVDQKEQIPVASACELGPVPAGSQPSQAALLSLAQQAVTAGKCSPGIFYTNQLIFKISGSEAQILSPLKTP
jgi:hypothetical protein